MRYALLKYPLIAIVLLQTVQLTFGQERHPEDLQDEPWVAEVPCRQDAATRGQGYVGDREFWLCFRFDANALEPNANGGANHSNLLISSYGKRGGRNLTGINIKRMYPDDHPGLEIPGTATPGQERNWGNQSTFVEFKVPISVTSQARSEKYPLSLEIVSGNQASDVDFSLPILAPSAASVSVTQKAQSLIDCWAGSQCSALQLEVRNRLPYKLTISNISISSDDVLEDKPVGEYPKEVNVNSAPLDLKLATKANGINVRRVLSGFGKPQFSLRIDFKDEYGRPLSTETTANVQIRPNILVVVMFLILGAVVGTLVRIDLKRLERAGIITRKERIVFAATTFSSGILVCLIALFANIKITAWSDQTSYSAWDPAPLFLTALVATVAGLPILYAYLRLPAATGPSSKSPPSEGARPDKPDKDT